MNDTPRSDFAYPFTARGDATIHGTCYDQSQILERELTAATARAEKAEAALREAEENRRLEHADAEEALRRVQLEQQGIVTALRETLAALDAIVDDRGLSGVPEMLWHWCSIRDSESKWNQWRGAARLPPVP